MPTTILTRTHFFTVFCVVAAAAWPSGAGAVSSAELYTNASYTYGRFDARVQYAAGDGVVSSFFLWKERSEQSGVFWNELDFEKLWADCSLATNALYGSPEMSHSEDYGDDDMCTAIHTYTYEWTPDYIAWLIDGVEIRRDTGDAVGAFRDNAAGGMRIHFNVWPGDATFGGNFEPAILPVHQYVNWVQYSAYVDGDFQVQWREDFDGGGVPSGWSTATWPSPKNLSTHSSANVAFINGYAVLSLTADNATGSSGAMPLDPGTTSPGPDTDENDPDEGSPGDDQSDPETDVDSGAPDGPGGATSDDVVDDANEPGAGGVGDSSSDAAAPANEQQEPDVEGTPPAGGASSSGDDGSPLTGAGGSAGQPISGAPADVSAPTTADTGSTGVGSAVPSAAGSGVSTASSEPPVVDSSSAADGGSGCGVTAPAAGGGWMWCSAATGAWLAWSRRRRRRAA
jgi:hypothetical protein